MIDGLAYKVFETFELGKLDLSQMLSYCNDQKGSYVFNNVPNVPIAELIALAKETSNYEYAKYYGNSNYAYQWWACSWKSKLSIVKSKVAKLLLFYI